MLTDLSSYYTFQNAAVGHDLEAHNTFRTHPNYDVKGFEIYTTQSGTMKDCTFSEALAIMDTLVPDGIKISYTNAKFVAYNSKLCAILDLHVPVSPMKKQSRTVALQMHGESDIVFEKHQWFKDTFTPSTDCYISWLYMQQNGSLENKTFYVSRPKSFDESYYPYIPDVRQYMCDFHNSSSNILILLGPPGTGKSTFLKEMLYTVGENAFTTYDTRVMQTDSLYVQFLNSTYRYLILEDSDVLLLSRDKDDNRVMSKILNASDGLVSTNKKFIFTANLANESQIDEALTRPGRCFDIRHFRHLSQKEAGVVADKLDKNLPEKDEYSLAEIFNNKVTRKAKDKVGFIV